MPGKRGRVYRDVRELAPNSGRMVTKSEEDSTLKEAIGATSGITGEAINPRRCDRVPAYRRSADQTAGNARSFVERFRAIELERDTT